MLFVNANVIHHVQERGAIIGENAQGTHGEIYKSHISVISSHFFDQVQIFFFLTHCIVVKVRLRNQLLILEHIGGFHAISGDTNNNGEMNKQSELMSDLLFTVHQHGGNDVT